MVLALAYVFVVVVCLCFENSLIFQPLPAERYWIEKPDPRIQDVWATSQDGAKVHGWWLPPRSPELGAVLYCHGNGGNVAACASIMTRMHDELGGMGVLVFDYPGYGKSEGSPNESSCINAVNAMWILLAKELKVNPQRVVLMGESLGGGVAADLASRSGPRALVLARTYSTLPAIAKDRFPFLPTQWLMRNRFDSTSKLGRLPIPVMIAHGTEDTNIRPYHAKQLYAAAKEPKTLYWMEGTGHNEALPESFYAALREFLATKAL